MQLVQIVGFGRSAGGGRAVVNGAACGVSAVTTVLALVSSVAAYYCIYIVAVLLFALAVYYAIRQL